jgi:RNA polymerase-associated protein RTF1
MSDLDEDLLALAGAGEDGSTEEDTSLPKGVKREYAAEDERSGDDDMTEDEDMFVNPYPLEGKYKDEKDRAVLEAMPEIERESILFDRSQEMQQYNERRYLAQRARDRKQEEKDTVRRTSGRDKTSGPTSKKSKLSELKQKRQEKHRRAEGRVGYQQESSESEEESRSELESGSEENLDEYETDAEKSTKRRGTEKVEWAESKPQKEITVNDINKIQWGKTLFSKFCHNPGFEEVVVGCFVRVNIGFNREKQTYVYRACQVKRLVDCKPYTFENRTVDQNLVVAHGTSEKTFEMAVCSDKSITEEEFNWWKGVMEKAGLGLPSLRRMDRKYDELKTFQSRTLTAAEINDMIKRRQELTGNTLGANTVIEKSMLQQKRAIAVENGRLEELEEIDRQIEDIDRILNKTKRRVDMDKLAKVNERNRKSNLEEIRRAEVLAVETRRKEALNHKSNSSNPFNRLRTSARIFYESTSPRPESPKPEQSEKPEEDQKDETMIKKKTATLDELIADLDIPLEVEI